MANLFSILPNIQLTSNDITEAELFAQQYLQAQFPDLDLREGTGIRDLLIRPTATLIALVNKGIEYHFENNTLEGINDESPEEIVDGIMSNLFLDRNEGIKAKVAARLYFSRKKNITISSGLIFSPDDKVKFNPETTYIFTPDDMTFDQEDGGYYVDVFLVSQGEGVQYNVDSGSLLYFTNFDPYFLRGEISYLKERSSPKETNSEFIGRAYSAISTRNLINNPSITSRIQSEFPDVNHVITVGYGNTLMARDKAVIQDENDAVSIVHLGGNTDVYCSAPIVESTEQYITDSYGNIQLTGAYLKVVVTDEQGGELANEIGTLIPNVLEIQGYDSAGNITTYNLDNGFSSKQVITIKFGKFNAGKVVSFQVWKFNSISSIQTFLEHKDNRVTCGDMLARALSPYLISIVIETYDKVIPKVEDIKPIVSSYIRGLAPGDTFYISDLTALLYAQSDLAAIVTPIDVSYISYDNNGVNNTGSIVDKLSPPNEIHSFVLDNLTIVSR